MQEGVKPATLCLKPTLPGCCRDAVTTRTATASNAACTTVYLTDDGMAVGADGGHVDIRPGEALREGGSGGGEGGGAAAKKRVLVVCRKVGGNL